MRNRIHSFTQVSQFPRRVFLKARKTEVEQRMRLPPWISAALYRVPSTACSSAPTVSSTMQAEKPVFNVKKILILSKVTRYEFEHKTNRGVQDNQLEEMLKRRGSDFNRLKSKHEQHHDFVNTIEAELQRAGVQTRIVQRMDYTDDVVRWADCIVSAGGDGTFLLAASRVRDSSKPVIGINTDPSDHIQNALERLFTGNFEWLFRQRIRISLTADATTAIPDAIELHDQQMNRKPSISRWSDNPREQGSLSPNQYNPPPTKRTTRSGSIDRVTIDLPVLALNEVFIGESLSSRVSYYELKVDGDKTVKQKSSGLTICTGTGSTSWYFNINKLTDQCVTEMLKIVKDRCKVDLPTTDKNIISDVVDGGVSYRFNDGAEALLEVREEDALRTVVFR